MMNASGWEAFTGEEVEHLPADHAARAQAMREPEPIAEIHIFLHGLEEQESEVRLRVDPHGPLGNVHAHGAARAAAYETLIATLQREIRGALTTLNEYSK